MALRLYDSNHTNLLVEKTYPKPFFSATNAIVEHVTRLPSPLVEGFYREICFEGVHIGYGNAILRNQVTLGFESDLESIEMHFALKGSNSVTCNNFDHQVTFDTNQHNIIYANAVSGLVQWNSKEFQLLEINMSPSFFKRFLPEDNKLFDQFRQALAHGRSHILTANHKPINHQMYQIIDDIISCERKGLFKKIFLEAKILELLLLQFEQIETASTADYSLKKADIDKIYAVRSYMLSHLDSTNSLAGLAQLVGTNEFTLKKGFKEVFGNTVFGFWNDAKMEEAKARLVAGTATVGEVAETIGYTHQRHFATAFKRKFGILPSQLKK